MRGDVHCLKYSKTKRERHKSKTFLNRLWTHKKYERENYFLYCIIPMRKHDTKK